MITPSPTSVRPASNCGLTSATTSPPGQQRRYHRQDVPQRDERHIDGHDLDRAPGRSAGVRCAGIEVLDDDDARVGAQLPVDLPVTDVERHDACGAALQQHVGESAGRRADVERLASGDVDLEGVERVGQLEPAAPDIGMIGRDQFDGRAVSTRCRPWSPAGRTPHLAGEDQRPRAFARSDEPTFDEQLIETEAHGVSGRTMRRTRIVPSNAASPNRQPHKKLWCPKNMGDGAWLRAGR